MTKTLLSLFYILFFVSPLFLGCYGASFINDKLNQSTSPDGPTSPVIPKNVSKVRAGEQSCVLYDRSMQCWGSNTSGEIGVIGAPTTAFTPLTVFSDQNIQAVDVGSGFTCAVIDGGVKCVGAGGWGELGHGVMSDSTTFVDAFPSGSGVTDLSAGFKTTCAIVNGGLYCWGQGGSFQIGNGSIGDQSSPVQIFAPNSGVTKVTVGSAHTCAVIAGELWCWGNNGSGQIGNGNFVVQTVPLKIVSLGTGITDVAAGENHTCAIKDGGLLCWGLNDSGQVGDNSIVNRSSPVAIFPPASGVTQVSLGGSHSCALVNSELKCWGSNRWGQMNDMVSIAPKLTPATILNASSMITDFSSGPLHVCVVEQNRKVSCWGAGLLGNGIQGDSVTWTTPQAVLGLDSNVNQLARIYLLNDDGNYINCAIQNGGVKCWGDNNFGQLGNGTLISSRVPVVAIPDLSGVTDLSLITGTTNSSVCAVVNGGIQCWGSGYGTSPLQIIAGGSGVTSVEITQSDSGFEDYGCAVVNGGVRCWGINNRGQLGNNSVTASPTTPVVPIANGSGVTKVVVRQASTCAVVNGGLRCWGYNNRGQLGDGTLVQKLVPTQIIPSSSGVTDVALIGPSGTNGNATTCAVVNGGLKCWGSNSFGLVGDGTTINRSLPVDIFPPSSGVTDVFGSDTAVCAIKNSGLYCWGLNTGVLGVGDAIDRLSPTLVIAESSGVTSADMGWYLGCAVVNGGLKCWGNNGVGSSLGNGTVNDSLIPVEVLPPGSNVQDVKIFYSTATCALINGGQKCWGVDIGYGILGNGSVTRGSFPVTGFD